MGILKENEIKIIKTAILIIMWFARGFENSMIGSTMPDMRVRFGTDAAGVSYALSVGKAGALVGSLAAGLLDRYGNHYDLICGCLVLIMVTSSLLKVSSTFLWLFTVCMLFEEFAWAMLCPGSESMIIKLWTDNASPFLQALQLGYPIGAIFGPLVASKFVSANSTTTNNETGTSNETEASEYIGYVVNVEQSWGYGWFPFNIHEYANEKDNDNEYANKHNYANVYANEQDIKDFNVNEDNYDMYDYSDDRYPDDSQIQYAFYIGAILLFISACGLFTMYFSFRKNAPKFIAKPTLKWREIFSPAEWTEGEKWMGVFMLTLMVLFFIAFDAQYNVLTTYITVYAVDSGLGFTNEEAAKIMSLFSLTGSISRFIAIFTTTWLPVTGLFLFHINTSAFTFLLLALLGPQSATNLLVLVALFGFFFRPAKGLVFGFLNIYILVISNLIGLTRFGSSFCSIFLQALHGYLYNNTVIESIFYIGTIYGCIYVVAHFLMLLLGKSYGSLEQRRAKKQEDTSFKIITNVSVNSDNKTVEKNTLEKSKYGEDLTIANGKVNGGFYLETKSVELAEITRF